MEPAGRYFTDEALEQARQAIRSASGNEVLLAGRLDEACRIHEVLVLTRGHQEATLAVLHAFRGLQERDQEGSLVAVHNHPSGDLTPSTADLGVAQQLSQLGVGTIIVDNPVEEAYAVVEPGILTRVQPLRASQIHGVFLPGGPLAGALRGYEDRQGQRDAAMAVAAALNEDQLLLVEAGTGVGKSLAYLVPALAWACTNKEQVVVSTNTLHLQDQLRSSDLPILSRALPDSFRAVLLKGRGNYVCRRKVERLRSAGSLLFDSAEDEERAEALFAWIDSTQSGDRAELTFGVPGTLWGRVASEAETCLRLRCPHNPSCFYYQARRAAAAADLLIVNHSLLFSDLALRSRSGDFEHGMVLPPIQRLILDEAHHVEDTAARHFGTEVTRAGTLRLLGRLVSARDSRRGVLPYLAATLPLWAGPAMRLIPAITAARDELHRHFAVLDEAVVELARELSESQWQEPGGTVTLRLGYEALQTGAYRKAHGAGRALQEVLAELTRDLRPVVSEMEEAAERDASVMGEVAELSSVVSSLKGVRQALEQLLRHPEAEQEVDTVRWVERRAGERGPALHLASAPVEVGDALGAALHDSHRTVVFTSATLTVGSGEFDHVSERLGLAHPERRDRLTTLEVSSPFDYQEHCLLGLPADLGDPDEPGTLQRQARLFLEAVRLSQGHAFLLCTSYRAMGQFEELLEEPLAAEGLPLLVQGQLSRHVLLQRFCKLPGAVLLGTDSFWEGVDVRGDALRLVAIHRLPFRPPGQPLEEARLAALTAQGRNAFAEYSLPRAILRLKQGFGRLIRTTTDRGVVLMLDSRVLTRRYGPLFLGALPPARQARGSTAQVLQEIQQFYTTDSGQP